MKPKRYPFSGAKKESEAKKILGERFGNFRM